VGVMEFVEELRGDDDLVLASYLRGARAGLNS
jgi:hypothetical protein